MRYEEILRRISGCGLFLSVFLIFVACTTTRVSTSINMLIFQLTTPTLTCITPNSTLVNVSFEMPSPGWCDTDAEYPSCGRWTYATDNRMSVVQEWNLCNDRMKVLFIQTTFIIGFGIGSYIGAFAADKYGRIRTYFVLYVFDCVNLITIAFSVNYWMFMVCGFFSQILNGGVVVTFYTFLNEIFYPSHRRYVEFFTFTWCSLGLGVLAFCAFMTQSWRHLELFQTIFCVTNILLILLFIRESPKWLLVTNRPKAARNSLLKMATWRTKSKLPEDFFNDIEIAKEKKCASFRDLGSSLQLMINTATSTLVLAMAVMVYYVITWNSESFLTGSIYINAFVMGLTEMPNTVLYAYLAKRLSKKKMLMTAMILCGATLIVGSSVKHFLPTMPAIFNSFTFASRMAANFSHNILFSLIPEVFPTSLRGHGFGLASFGSRLLSAPMPYILMISDRENVLIPSLVMAGIIIISSFSLILLPDTFRCRLPDTVEESRLFKRGNEHIFRIKEKNTLAKDEADK